jgi:hypothetical protein
MPIVCEKTSVFYPLLADVYYPIVDQGAYGNVSKSWVLDATIACAFDPATSKRKMQVGTEPNVVLSVHLVGRTRHDIRISSVEAENAITNIVVTNIRDKYSNIVYLETSGPRRGKPTIFEIATNEPVVGAFGKVEYYRLLIRRSENQAVDV